MDIAQVILQAGLASQEQLAQALELQKETGSALPYILCKLRVAEETELAARLAALCRLSADPLEDFIPDMELLSRFPSDFLIKNQLLPLSHMNGRLRVGVIQPCPDELLDQMRLIAGEKVEIVVVPPLRAIAALEDGLGRGREPEGAKVKQPHRHYDGRMVLNELVQELSEEAEVPKQEKDESDDALYGFETRELLFGLINTLVDLELLQRQDIIRAVRAMRGE